MEKVENVFYPSDPELFIKKALSWCQRFEFYAYFYGNEYSYPFGAFPQLLFIDAEFVLKERMGCAFEILKSKHNERKNWLVGYLGYDLKNEVENLRSENSDFLQTPDMYFFEPKIIIRKFGNQVNISASSPRNIYDQIFKTQLTFAKHKNKIAIPKRNMPKEEYLQKVEKIKNHIVEGDVYELNLCMEYQLENVEIDPLSLYLKLNEISPMPFSTFIKLDDINIISASPERFLKKSEYKLVAQPIKGTRKRGNTEKEDKQLKIELKEDEKERAENMMIVDLMRNDLARSSSTGSVKVEEMFGIYSFNYVHQMISTVSASLRPDIHFIDAIRNAFPMGSMTGAPKVKTMELIELYENHRRGIFSGAAGYITPEGDFDFNVIIRTMLYDQKNKQLSFSVGSAITYDANAEKEYQECMIKIFPILKCLGVHNRVAIRY